MSALRVVHVSLERDAQRRTGTALLSAWPTLPSAASAVAREGVHTTVVVASHARLDLEQDGVTFHFIDDARRVPFRVIEQVVSLQPDVVHVNGLDFPWAVRSVVRAMRGTPVLLQDHGSVAPGGWRARASGWAYRDVAGVAFTARDQVAAWKRAGVFRTGLPVFEALESSSDFSPGDRELARHATGIFGDPCLLWTSHLDANKDPLTMLDAVERAASELPDLRLWCCFGFAPLLADVTRRIATSPVLAKHVTLLGARRHDEMEDLFRAADLYVQTSHREGSGYSLLEALACGATPVVTDIPAMRRIVGAAGSVTPLGDARALAAAIVRLAAHDAGSLRIAARARFDDALTFRAVGRELRAAYETLSGVSSNRQHAVAVDWQAHSRAPALGGMR